jgi:hypothetical protein
MIMEEGIKVAVCPAQGNLIRSGHLHAEQKESFHHGRRQQG